MKSILIIDTPDNCSECQFCGWGGRNLEKYVCCLTREHSEEPHLVGCPLKPVPSKKVSVFDPNSASYDEEYEKRIMYEIDGYNRCIDEIMG